VLAEKIEKYKQSGSYYINNGIYEVVWSDRIGEWGMSASTKNMRSCLELDKVDRALDEFGYEIVIGEFGLDPDKYKLAQIRYANPLKLRKLASVHQGK